MWREIDIDNIEAVLVFQVAAKIRKLIVPSVRKAGIQRDIKNLH